MSLVKVQGNASGTGIFTIASPNSNTDRTLNLPDQSGTLFVNSANGALSVDPAAPANSLAIASTGNATFSGTVKSNSGGFVFPDNTTQTTAAVAGPGASGTRGQVFTGNGTFTIPTGITAVKVTVVGGGGGGSANQGGSGGGGGAAIKFLTSLTPGGTLAVTVGGAGSGAGGASAGGTGGTSSVASGTQSITTVSASGGAGGVSQSGFNVFAAGGSGASGDINISGTTGGGNSLVVAVCGFPHYWTSSAGSSILGVGAGIRQSFNGQPSVATSIGYGAGGQASMGGGSGAAGSAGIVIFEW